jgi:Predicted site-specific integrase-resolvase
MNRIPDAEVLLTPKEVAQRFHVNPKTVTRWAKAGKLTAIRTLVDIVVIANQKFLRDYANTRNQALSSRINSWPIRMMI